MTTNDTLSFVGIVLAALAGCHKGEEEMKPTLIAFAIDRAGTSRDIMTVDPKGGEPVGISPAEFDL
jgi:hypothetical protein